MKTKWIAGALVTAGTLLIGGTFAAKSEKGKHVRQTIRQKGSELKGKSFRKGGK